MLTRRLSFRVLFEVDRTCIRLTLRVSVSLTRMRITSWLALIPAVGMRSAISGMWVLVLPINPVQVPDTHPRNHSGTHFSTLVTLTVDGPQAGSEQIDRAYEDAWLGAEGRALAFLGDVVGKHVAD